MLQQKNRSRAATALDMQDWVIFDDASSRFIGYNQLETKAGLLKYRKVSAKGNNVFHVVLDKTPFYAESGGQVGDTGFIRIDGNEIPVLDTKKENDLIIHITEEWPETISDSRVFASVNAERRKKIALHHSATHLLHAALQKVLGTHVAQKGSLVQADSLRFDFSHFSKMSSGEIAAVVALVNAKIRENIPVLIKEMPREEALEMGAMALFGEKYGATVRVVIIDPSYSVELCGGTHVGATGELGTFRILHETAVAAGVRRVEAVTGLAAELSISEEQSLLASIREQLKNPRDLNLAISNLLTENADLRKKLEQMELAALSQIREELLKKAESVNDYRYIASRVDVNSPEALKKLAYELRSAGENMVVVLGAAINEKAFVAVAIGESLVTGNKLDAGNLIKTIVAPLIKGGGGGQKNLATAGGKDISGMEQVIAKIRAQLES